MYLCKLKRNTMKRFLAAAVLALATFAAQAQSFSISISGDIPGEAKEVLVQRFTQMLESGGFTVEAEAQPLEIIPTINESMTTPGSMSQKVLVLDIKARAGEVEETFTVKGVGKDTNDAWLRAVKQLLPSSRAAKEFLQTLQ